MVAPQAERIAGLLARIAGLLAQIAATQQELTLVVKGHVVRDRLPVDDRVPPAYELAYQRPVRMSSGNEASGTEGDMRSVAGLPVDEATATTSNRPGAE